MSASRRLRRFYSLCPLPCEGERVCLSPEETRHLKRTLRLGLGDSCLLMDSTGNEAEACIQSFSKSNQACLKIERRCSSMKKEAVLFLRVVQAMPQKGKMEFLIEKSQELGVEEFWPIEARQSTVRISPDQEKKVFQRWHKKSIAAAKQSGAIPLLSIGPIRLFERALKDIPEDEEVAVFHPHPDSILFRNWIQGLDERLMKKEGARLNLFFGAEGGFHPSEIEVMRKQKDRFKRPLQMVSLGPHILRVETAFLGVISALRLLYHE